MLGRDTPEASIFNTKSAAYLKSCRIVSTNLKICSWVIIILFNLFCILTCILYGATKGPDWRAVWISLSSITLFLLLTVDMSYEAIMIGFILPSQIINSVRTVQANLNKSLVSHSLPGIPLINRRNRNADTDHRNGNGSEYNSVSPGKNPHLFSASSYLFVSYFLAMNLKWIPESSLVLSYMDPLPHVQFTPSRIISSERPFNGPSTRMRQTHYRSAK